MAVGVVAHVSEEIFIAIPVDVARADQTLELFQLQPFAGDLPLQLSDDLLHAATLPRAHGRSLNSKSSSSAPSFSRRSTLLCHQPTWRLGDAVGVQPPGAPPGDEAF
jgi:hypothetical protein